MDPQGTSAPPVGLLDRFRQSWFPPAAVVGAFAAFTAAAFRSRPAARPASVPARPPAAPERRDQPAVSAAPALPLERKYSLSAVVGGATSAHPFRRSLAGISVGAEDRFYALGDEEVRIFEPGGDLAHAWRVPPGAACLVAGLDGRVLVGSLGRVEIYDTGGRHTGGFAAGEAGRPAAITSIKLFQDEILVGDAAARRIRRYDSAGRQLGEIGTQNKTRGFILPNRSLDFDVDAGGVVRATDSGRHRVTAWALDGAPLGHFGKFGQRNPEEFVGCCNPVNLALTPDGKVVTGEKMVARVKVYEPDGRLLALIGSEHFDPNCTHLHLDVDSSGRILVADPVRREVKVFSQGRVLS